MAKVSPAEVEKSLRGLDFPVSKDMLIKHARSNDASEEVLDTLDALPDEEYASLADINKAIDDTDM
jgi:hypothetical protein